MQNKANIEEIKEDKQEERKKSKREEYHFNQLGAQLTLGKGFDRSSPADSVDGAAGKNLKKSISKSPNVKPKNMFGGKGEVIAGRDSVISKTVSKKSRKLTVDKSNLLNKYLTNHMISDL